jgi:hypothetical protein
LTFASIIADCLAKHRDIPLKNFYFFWNQPVKNENRRVYDAYSAIIEQLKIDVLKTEIPFTIKYKQEMSADGKRIFRSTLFPPERALMKGTGLDSLIEEICQIIKLQ